MCSCVPTYNYSTEDAVMYATDRYMQNKDVGLHTGVVFVDMSTAFDKVQYQTLMKELQDLGLQSTVMRWFADYLSGRRQRVFVSGDLSLSVNCSRDVPQGSVLGPVLFSLYTRPVPTLSPSSHTQVFADDYDRLQ